MLSPPKGQVSVTLFQKHLLCQKVGFRQKIPENDFFKYCRIFPVEALSNHAKVDFEFHNIMQIMMRFQTQSYEGISKHRLSFTE